MTSDVNEIQADAARTADDAPAAAPRGGGIQSLERATAILEAVAAHPDGIGLADISALTGLHTSTAFHLAKTLVALGYISQIADSRRYRIGARLFALAAGALDDTTLLHQATPVLENLSTRTNEAAHLAVRSRHEIRVIQRTAAPGLLQLSDRTGALRPAHATAIGKLLLAAMADADLEPLLQTLPLPAFTANTITDVAALRRELADIRRDGIAHDRCEFDIDVRCIAMPVLDFAGRHIAAIGISGPVWRMTPDAVDRKSAILAEAARDLSARLGHRG